MVIIMLEKICFKYNEEENARNGDGSGRNN